MIINNQSLLLWKPIEDMRDTKVRHNGVTHGLSEAGYDIRLKQDITFKQTVSGAQVVCVYDHDDEGKATFTTTPGRFVIASAMEKFQMPTDMVGVVHDKSSWARQGLSVFNTVVEPGWNGFLTLELVYHGNKELRIKAGSGIAQVIFHRTMSLAQYQGRYQNQADRPVEAIEG